MKLANSLIVFLLILILGVSSGFSQQGEKEKQEKKKGKIGEFEKALAGEDEEEDNDGQQSTESGSPVFSFFFDVFDDAFLYLTFGPIFPDDSVSFGNWLWQRGFTAYPYEENEPGLYSEHSAKRYAVSFSSHYFYNSTRLNGMGVNGWLAPFPFLAVEFQFTDLTEEYPGGFDHIRFYSFFANYFRVRRSHWQFWWGVGAKFIEGSLNKGGMAFNLGMNLYPIKPFSGSFNYNISAINSRSVGDLRLQLNFHLRRANFYIGYQRYSVGGVVLDGMLLGAGLYF